MHFWKSCLTSSKLLFPKKRIEQRDVSLYLPNFFFLRMWAKVFKSFFFWDKPDQAVCLLCKRSVLHETSIPHVCPAPAVKFFEQITAKLKEQKHLYCVKNLTFQRKRHYSKVTSVRNFRTSGFDEQLFLRKKCTKNLQKKLSWVRLHLLL